MAEHKGLVTPPPPHHTQKWTKREKMRITEAPTYWVAYPMFSPKFEDLWTIGRRDEFRMG